MTGPRIPADTTREAAEVQERLFAAMTPTERLGAALELSESVRRVSMAGLRHRNPDLSEEKLRARFIELLYGTSV